jgi:hypothetical protein
MVEQRKSNLATSTEQDLTKEEPAEEPEPPQEPAFSYEFDEPEPDKRLHPVAPQPQQAQSASGQSLSQSIKEKMMQGVPLTRRERLLMQAARAGHTPTNEMNSSVIEKTPSATEETGPVVVNAKSAETQRMDSEKPVEAPEEPKMHTREDIKGFQNNLWKLIGGKWF